MRYKGDYYPQYVLDPQTYSWDLFDSDLRRRMDVRKYVCLSEEREREGVNGGQYSDSLRVGFDNGDNKANGVEESPADLDIMDADEEGDENMEVTSRLVKVSFTYFWVI